MTVALIPYTLHDSAFEPEWRGFGARYVWALPSNVTSAIDLRPVTSVTDLTAVGYAIGLVDGDLPDGAVSLQTNNVSRDKSTWRQLLGFTPDGDTPGAWLRSHLLAGADEAGEAACRPLRGSRTVDIWLGGCVKHELDPTERLQQAVFARRDLDKIFDAVERGELPAHHHRKVLAAYAADLGINPLALRSKASRWRGESPLTPETTISEPFKPDGVVQLNGYNGWTAVADRFTTGNGLLYISGPGDDETYRARPATSLSSANSEATLSDLTGGSFHPAGPMCRSDIGHNNYYATDHWSTEHRLYRVNSGVGTAMSSVAATAGSSRTLTVRAIASTIRGTDTSGWRHTVTDTSITTGLYVGFWAYIQQTSSGQRTASAFSGRDFVTPTITSIAPTSGPSAGGTGVVITGTNFETNMSATIGGASTTGVSVTPPTTLGAAAPAGSAGARDVVVTNTDSGFTATLAGGFTYVDPVAPVVDAVVTTSWLNPGTSGSDGVGLDWAGTSTPPYNHQLGSINGSSATPIGLLYEGNSTRFLTVRNYDTSSIPAGSTIVGLRWRLTFTANNVGLVDFFQRKNVPSGTNEGTDLGASQAATAIVGSTSSLNGLSSLSLAELQSANFGCAARWASTSEFDGSLAVDCIQLEVTYVRNNAAAGFAGDGGSFQLAAANTPTSWAILGSPAASWDLLGNPPTGVAINNDGLVTWTRHTPPGVHSIAVRATNAVGSGDGTLTLTIVARPATGIIRPQQSQLRLNPAHPLCQPSRNLVFATFGTGAGGQVLDLADRPSHGYYHSGGVNPQLTRSIQSNRPPSVPADWQPLSIRGTASNQAVQFTSSKFSERNTNYTISLWFRPFHTSATPYRFLGIESNGGGWRANNINGLGVTTRADDSDAGYYQTSYAPTVGEWLLVTIVFGTSGPVAMYANADQLSPIQNDNSGPPASDSLLVGSVASWAPNADIGPCMVWGTRLSADDIALLYRDTWGMVTRNSLLPAPRTPERPVVANNTAAAAFSAGGTVQMAATDTPTAWSLL